MSRILQSNQEGAIHDYDGDTVITNCLITDNIGGVSGGGVYFHQSNSTIANCVISRNTSARDPGGGLYCYESTLTLINCTITANSAPQASGIYSRDNSEPTLSNCILWNGGDEIVNDESTTTITYSNVQGGWDGLGNIDIEPEFVQPGYWDPNGTSDNSSDDFWVDGDYHLKSEGWRWDMRRGVWTWDDVTSRCIDGGNPASLLGDEPLYVAADPNNEFGVNRRINMGAYGGTAEASIGPDGWALLADLNNDGIVSFPDLAHQAARVQEHDTEPPGDLDRNGAVDMLDVALLVEDWLRMTTWYE